MNTENSRLNRKDVPRPVAEMAVRLLPGIARKKAATGFPDLAGLSYLYEVRSGWEGDALRLDPDIQKATTTQALEAAFADPSVKAVLIPADGSITRQVALKICRRHGHGKTIFYEVHDE